MIKLFEHSSNNQDIKRFLIQGKSDSEVWLEFKMDLKESLFQCQKKKFSKLPKDWVKSSGYTFPSSLLNEFIREAETIDE